MERGLVLVLPGIEGRSIYNVNVAEGLNDGGVDCGIEILEWGTNIPGGFLINLTDQRRNIAVADRISRRIRLYQAGHPGRQVHLIGHSGGGGIALMAVERLAAESAVESLTLLAPAVSPEYDLRPALQRTRNRIFNCYSDRDVLLLGVGTLMMGTIDRKYGESAGKVGFHVPGDRSSEDRQLFLKLRQRPWKPEMQQLGNDGSHCGWTDRRFVRAWIAPVIRRMLEEQPATEIQPAFRRLSVASQNGAR